MGRKTEEPDLDEWWRVDPMAKVNMIYKSALFSDTRWPATGWGAGAMGWMLE